FSATSGRAKNMYAALAGARRRYLFGTVLVLSLGAICAWAADPDTKTKTDPPSSPPAAKPAEKTFAFAMDGKPWNSVIEWLTDQPGLQFNSEYMPTGSFNYIGPKGKTYTLNQIIDILNEGLASQKFMIIRREQSFTLLPADKEIDSDLVPRILLEDLDK